MDIGLLAAFLGGTLALLSPCGALLLPAFFAATVGTGPRLLLHGALFYAGLLTVLVPLGLGVGALGSVVATQRDTIVLVTAIVLVLLGLAQMAGLGFDAASALPGIRGLQESTTRRTGALKTVLLGAAGGVTGFCVGPILGAVLTLAATRGNTVAAGGLLAVYGAGMVVPLLLIAAAWHRMSDHSRAALRGRPVRVFGRELHSTSLLTGALIVALGVLFWATDGLLTMPELVPVSTQDWLQQQVAALARSSYDVIAIVLVAAVVLVVWARKR
ncbi:cytochrome c biogenesis CcdA family protein [Austwickia chelonae]|uniref:cytochrome c biogenesis CcdA family protein n=1 Tax=Austwickia chelonae TaxID=100225 RepID=UPI000E279FC8|nr:cytochrome c biogenesis CcdA family protein [Austwickia chelonae]